MTTDGKDKLLHQHPPPPGSWPAARAAARRFISPVQTFLAIEAASGIVLLAATLIALAWANSPWHASYQALLHAPLGFRIGGVGFERDVHFWINDGLMVVFFFVVGLEIKRELNGGELSGFRRAALPAFAALGGMVVPAGIFLLFNAGTIASSGWGVPVATDIAFAVGILALLGKRVPPPLRILLLALAVIDDVGAILVIALFYSSGINPWGLALAGSGIAAILGLQKLGVRSAWAYLPPALLIWAGTYAAGIHPTIAGVVVGLLTPLDMARREAVSPVERLQHDLHRWVAFGIMPLFALANAGVALRNAPLDGPASNVLLGVMVGLVLGKPIGVMTFSWLAVRLRVAALPTGVPWSGMLVVGLVAGIGFTMSLFIASLAFADEPAMEVAKLGILAASAVAALIGSVAGRLLLTAPPQVSAPANAVLGVQEPETSTHH